MRATIAGSASRCGGHRLEPAPRASGRRTWSPPRTGTGRRRVLVVPVGAAQVGRMSAVCAVHHVGSVRLGGDVHGQPSRRIAASSDLGVGGGQRRSCRPSPRRRRLAVAKALGWPRRRRSRARAAARSRTPCRGRPGTFRRLLPDAHGPVALDVGVPAHRAQPRRPGLPMLPCSSSTLTISLMVATECGAASRPSPSRRSCALDATQQPGHVLDLRPGQAGGLLDLVPVELRAGRAARPSKPSVCASMKALSTTVPGAASSAQQQVARAPGTAPGPRPP